MNSRRLPPKLSILLCLALLACATAQPDTINPTVVQGSVLPTEGSQWWRLPKTVLNPSVTYTYKGCAIGENGLPKLDVEVTVDPGITTLADPNPFEDGNGDRVQVPFRALSSFWQDRSLGVTRFPSGIVNKLNASAEDQTGTIIGNVLSSATKLASIGFGVPGAGGEGRSGKAPACGAAQATAKLIASLKAELKPLDPSSSRAKSLATRIGALSTDINIKVARTEPIDPFATTMPRATRGPCGRTGTADVLNCIAILGPTVAQVEKARWFEGATGDLNDLQVAFILDFTKASPSILRACPDSTPCEHHPTRITHDTMFREVAYIPLKVVRGASATTAGDPIDLTCAVKPCTIAFGQFGIPRALPTEAGLFAKFNWSLTFLESGEITDSAYGSSAVGVKATGLLSGASAAAASIATEGRNAISSDTQTTRIQAEVARLKALSDLADYRTKVDALRANGQLQE